MKNTLRLLCLMVGLLLLVACGDTGEVYEVELPALTDKMLAACESFPEMTTVTDADEGAETALSSVTTMDRSKMQHFAISYSSEGKADEVILLYLEDYDDVDEAEKALESHVQSRTAMYEQYNPAEASRMEKTEVFSVGRYVVAICCDDIGAVRAVMEAEVKQ